MINRQDIPAWPEKAFAADLHIHSMFSRATSKEMRPMMLSRVARQKGIKVMGTGDATHPDYLDMLEEELEPAEPGLYAAKADPGFTRFVLSAEVSNIFTQAGKGRRIHTVILFPGLEEAREVSERLAAIGNVKSDGRPIFGFPVRQLVKLVLNVSSQCLIIPAHIWTPWFSLLGSRSGFDSIEECFEEETEHIHALETGLSSDPQMNWRLSLLDKYTLVSNSDAHSPAKIGRELNLFTCGLSYEEIVSAIKEPDKGFEGTIEFFPEEGKYHLDGHRACGVRLTPKETIARHGLCPVCSRPLTIGVLHRVEELADRPEGYVPECAKPCVHLVPLVEILMQVFGVKSITSRVKKEYARLVSEAGSELDLLLWLSEQEITDLAPPAVADAIVKVRRGEVELSPGFDGEYGKVIIKGERDGLSRPDKKDRNPLRQPGLFD